MNRFVMAGVLVAVLALTLGGCKRVSYEDDSPTHHGRYAGVGLYGADHGWAHLAGAPKPTDMAVATTADDTMVIVTVDGATGELRQCGNYSGHCIAMNPWHSALSAKQSEPVSLTERPKAGEGDTTSNMTETPAEATADMTGNETKTAK